MKSNDIREVKKRLFKSVLDLRDLYSFRSSFAPDCWCKWHNSSLWKLRDHKRIWKGVTNTVSLFVLAALMFTDLRLLFQVSDKSRVEELSEFVVLVLQPGQLLLSLQQRVLQLREGEEQITLQNGLLWAPPGLGSDSCPHLFVSLQVRWQLLRPRQSSRWRAVENTLRLWQRNRDRAMLLLLCNLITLCSVCVWMQSVSQQWWRMCSCHHSSHVVTVMKTQTWTR